MLDEPESVPYTAVSVLRAIVPTNDSLIQSLLFFAPVFPETDYFAAGPATRLGLLANGRSLSVALLARPPLPDQRAIATALSDVDALLGGLEALIAKKRDLKQAALQQLLTGQTRLPGFHGEWEVKTLGDLFNFSGGYSASRSQLSTEGHCYLHYGDIHGATKTCVDARADYQDIPKFNIPLKRVSIRLSAQRWRCSVR